MLCCEKPSSIIGVAKDAAKHGVLHTEGPEGPIYAVLQEAKQHHRSSRGRRQTWRAPHRGTRGPDMCCSAESQAASKSKQRTPPSAARPEPRGQRSSRDQRNASPFLGRHCRDNEDLQPTLVLYTDHEVEEYFEYSAPEGSSRDQRKASPFLGRHCRDNEDL